MQLTEIHRVYKDDIHYKMLDDFAFKSKNLYNNALYHIRQYYLYYKKLKENEDVSNLEIPDLLKERMKDKGSYINYNLMDSLAKTLGNSLTEDYKSLPYSTCSQQVLRLLDKNWKSFFKSLKRYKQSKDGYKTSPRIPKYLSKNGRYIISLTNQNCKLKDGYLQFPKSFNGFQIKTKLDNFQQVRVVPKSNYYQIEIVYNIEDIPLKEDNKRYLSIDLGVNNLAAITNNFNGNQWLIKGTPIKSINQRYNKQKAYYQAKAKKLNNVYMTKRLNLLTINRNDRINTYLHKASKKLIDLAESYEVSKIVIGYNQEWKQEVNIGKINNQNFVGIPFLTFINQIKYKAKQKGIEVVLVEESYTSGTSYLDNELPIKENYNKGRRIYRGLFKSNTNALLNSDINGSYQILKKFIGSYYQKPETLKVLKVI